MADVSEDAVGVARARVESYFTNYCAGRNPVARRALADIEGRAIDDLIAAVESRVRAECAAKVRDIPNLAIDIERHPSLSGVNVDLCHRQDVLDALEAP